MLVQRWWNFVKNTPRLRMHLNGFCAGDSTQCLSTLLARILLFWRREHAHIEEFNRHDMNLASVWLPLAMSKSCNHGLCYFSLKIQPWSTAFWIIYFPDSEIVKGYWDESTNVKKKNGIRRNKVNDIRQQASSPVNVKSPRYSSNDFNWCHFGTISNPTLD